MTVDDVVEALGGTFKVAARFGLVPSAVSNWRRENRFPARLHRRLIKICEAEGVALDERLLDETAA